MNWRIACMLIALVGILVPFMPYAQSKELPVPKSLDSAIRKLAPSAKVVAAKDVDTTSCQPVGDSPGMVRADFNGDGRQDYAVLLKTRVSKEVTVSQSNSLREARFSFVLFLDNGRGGYQPIVVRRYEDFVPTIVVINLEPAGIIQHRETHKEVRVPNPAVMLSFCEKSATIYYLVNGKVRSIPISD